MVAVWDKYLVEVSIGRDRGQEPSDHRYMMQNRIGNHPRTPIDTIQKFACRVSREISVNVLLLLKVSKKPLRNNNAEARSF